MFADQRFRSPLPRKPLLVIFAIFNVLSFCQRSGVKEGGTKVFITPLLMFSEDPLVYCNGDMMVVKYEVPHKLQNSATTLYTHSLW